MSTSRNPEHSRASLPLFGTYMAILVWVPGLLIVASGADAQTPNGPALPPATNETWEATIEEHHHSYSQWIMNTADRLDRYFSELFKPATERRVKEFDHFLGDRRPNVEDQKSRIKVSPGISYKEGEDFDADVRFSASIDLPRLEDRIDLVIQNFEDDEDVLDEFRTRGSAPASALEEETDGSVSLRVKLKDRYRFKSSLSGGMSFRPEPVPKLKYRLMTEWDWGRFETRFEQSVYWDSDNGFGERSQIRFQDQPHRFHFRRLTTSVLWSETSEGVQAGETLELTWFLSNRRMFSNRYGISGHLEPSAIIDNYTARIVWRQLIYKNWVYLEIEPGIEWPNDRDWEETPFINVKLDILLGSVE